MTDALIVHPTRKRMNPLNVADSDFFKDRMLYVLENEDGMPAVVTTVGRLAGYELGTTHEARHDHGGYSFGNYTVVGIVNLSTGDVEGEVPDKKVKHWQAVAA